jgi:hypothetical protein
MTFMRWFLSILVSLQIVFSVLGQGALTLCVRQDGTQKLNWTWLSDCHSHADCDQHAGCECEEDCTLEAVSCTDYTVVTDVTCTATHRLIVLELLDCCLFTVDVRDSLVSMPHHHEGFGLPPPWRPPIAPHILRC